MKKLLLLGLFVCSSLFASINGQSEQALIKELKKELKIPYRVDNVSSFVEVYIAPETIGEKSKNIVMMYIIDGGSKFDKNLLKQAYNKDFNNASCNSSLKLFFGDNQSNTITYKVMFEGKESFNLTYNKENCKK